MQIIIGDTEPAVRRYLSDMVKNLGHEIVLETESLEAIITAIKMHHTDVILLNAHSYDITHFYQTLKQQFEYPPALIFSGLDDAHAILTALRAGAVDYLPIPVNEQDLDTALQKSCCLNFAQYNQITKQQGKKTCPRQYITARTHRGLELIALADVYYFTADQKYIKVRHKNGLVLIDETLKDLEQEFDGIMFRIHRNALINLEYLELLETVDNGQYQVRFRGMSEKLSVSRRHLPALREKIQHI
ncbi:LytR/AlgR family response regulator transcription factor [Moraxella oblonga]|uniref:LytR/AlgR family response regulator transcription factor n=1 Tax=Moraxella oblonga TaxID=200413 RepID=UPI00082ED7E9|nr:LytTR family DNA-binding domain-containing protein [Moraxella oblonga]